MQLNRAVAFILSYFWKKVAQNCKYVQIDRRLATEMLMALCVLPLMHSDLRLRTDACMSATDASGHAGGISRSACLTEKGEQAVEHSGRRGYQTCGDECALLNWFDGIGAVRQAWEYLRLPLGAYFSCENDPVCVRVLNSRWPHVEHLGDIRQITKEKLFDIKRRHPRLKKMCRSGGFPCQDVSGLNATGVGSRVPAVRCCSTWLRRRLSWTKSGPS